MKCALSSQPQGNCQDNQGNFLLCFKSEISVEKIDVLLQKGTMADWLALCSSCYTCFDGKEPEGLCLPHHLEGVENYLECSLGTFLFFLSFVFFPPLSNFPYLPDFKHFCSQKPNPQLRGEENNNAGKHQVPGTAPG